MPPDAVEVNELFLQAKWMLEHQVKGPMDLIRFWSVFGPYKPAR